MALPRLSQDQLEMGQHIVRQTPANVWHFTRSTEHVQPRNSLPELQRTSPWRAGTGTLHSPGQRCKGKDTPSSFLLPITGSWTFLSKLGFSREEVLSQTLYVSPLIRVFSQKTEDVDLNPSLKKEVLNLSPPILWTNVLATQLLWETKTASGTSWKNELWKKLPKKEIRLVTPEGRVCIVLNKVHKPRGREEWKIHPRSLCSSPPPKQGSGLKDAALYTNVQSPFQSNSRHLGLFVAVS